MAARTRDVAWAESAQRALDDIFGDIALKSPAGAAKVLTRALEAADTLSTLSERGRVVSGDVQMTQRIRFQLRYLLIASALCGSASCASSGAFWNGVAAGLADTPATGAASSIFPSSAELLIFGGQNHKVFLGCLNCSKYESNSVFNNYGTHGSKYSAESIFNTYGEYGSKYSSFSACNPYASDPPVIAGLATRMVTSPSIGTRTGRAAPRSWRG